MLEPREQRRDVVLDVAHLRVEYLSETGPICAVDDVSFELEAGEMLGLAGESGSGKTTVAQALLRILRPPAAVTAGSIRIDGADVLELSEPALRRLRWRSAALVMQSAMNALNPVLRVEDQIVDAIRAHSPVTRAEAAERARTLLELVEIDPGRLSGYPHELSGGMRQRVCIALALALEPRLIVMDEPTTALDVVVQREIMQRVLELREQLGFAVLLITHDLSLMLELATRVGVMYAGKLVELARAEALLENPQHPYTRALIGGFASLSGPRRKLTALPGAPADMRRLPAGCRFHPRCARAISICNSVPPPLRELGPKHSAACHLSG